MKAATTEQARALLTPNANSPTYVLRALNDLQRQGLVDSVPIGRARHKAWYLSRDGAAALNADGHTPKAGRRVRPLRASTAGNGLIHHALAITQVIADLAPVGAALADWELEAVHRWLPGSDQGRLIADAVLTRSWESDELPPVMMVEVDRNTLDYPRLSAELLAYLDYARARLPEPYQRKRSMPAYRRLYPYAKRCPPILLVLAGGTPAQLHRRARAVVDRIGGQVWRHLDVGVVLAAELTEAGPHAPIVTRLYAPDEPVPLARLPRPENEVADEQRRLEKLREAREQVVRLQREIKQLREQDPGWKDPQLPAYLTKTAAQQLAEARQQLPLATARWQELSEAPGPGW